MAEHHDHDEHADDATATVLLVILIIIVVAFGVYFLVQGRFFPSAAPNNSGIEVKVNLPPKNSY